MLPILFQSHSLIIYSYPLLMGLGWGVGHQIFFENQPSYVNRFHLQILFWGIFLFSWIGAKILFYLTLPFEVSGGMLSQVSFWTGGGFVFYGGLLGGLIFVGIYKLFGFSFNQNILWPVIPALTIGHGIGRIGCFLAGCCFGNQTDAWWGVSLHEHTRHPTQLIEAIGLLVLGFIFLKSRRHRGELFPLYMISYGFFRFLVEILRGDEIRGQWGTFTPSQWISIVLFISGSIIIFLRNKSKVFLS